MMDFCQLVVGGRREVMRVNEIISIGPIYAIYFFGNYYKKSKFNPNRKERKIKYTEYLL